VLTPTPASEAADELDIARVQPASSLEVRVVDESEEAEAARWAALQAATRGWPELRSYGAR
jgi:hypothetical protein